MFQLFGIIEIPDSELLVELLPNSYFFTCLKLKLLPTFGKDQKKQIIYLYIYSKGNPL